MLDMYLLPRRIVYPDTPVLLFAVMIYPDANNFMEILFSKYPTDSETPRDTLKSLMTRHPPDPGGTGSSSRHRGTSCPGPSSTCRCSQR